MKKLLTFTMLIAVVCVAMAGDIDHCVIKFTTHEGLNEQVNKILDWRDTVVVWRADYSYSYDSLIVKLFDRFYPGYKNVKVTYDNNMYRVDYEQPETTYTCRHILGVQIIERPETIWAEVDTVSGFPVWAWAAYYPCAIPDSLYETRIIRRHTVIDSGYVKVKPGQAWLWWETK